MTINAGISWIDRRFSWFRRNRHPVRILLINYYFGQIFEKFMYLVPDCFVRLLHTRIATERVVIQPLLAPRNYCSCGLNKFMFLMYQVGAGTSMFALGKTLSLFCKTAESLRFCSRFMIININTNYSRSSKSSMRIIFILSAHLFVTVISRCPLFNVFMPVW